MSMITATAWVPQGSAKEFPTRYNLDDSELSRISKLAQLELAEAKEDLENARHAEERDSENESESSGGSDDVGDDTKASCA